MTSKDIIGYEGSFVYYTEKPDGKLNSRKLMDVSYKEVTLMGAGIDLKTGFWSCDRDDQGKKRISE
ncbi:MAG: hypothetical protein IPP89_15850 [Saprospiraceae bacterium]|nr:hypothetical protein [Candidatus Brachybacter algidus]MBL0120406.1 hypothetical protein [Candidatus Brachybacter algidus]